MSEQVVVDSFEFARNGDTLRGKIAVADLSRLADSLCSSAGILEYALSGSVNSHGKPTLHCRVKGKLQLQCQRCLEAMEYALDTQSDLVLAQTEAELQLFDELEETADDAVLADQEFNVLALVEDEVLLNLPMAPRHSVGTCQPKSAGENDTGESGPFAVLTKLKQGK